MVHVQRKWYCSAQPVLLCGCGHDTWSPGHCGDHLITFGFWIMVSSGSDLDVVWDGGFWWRSIPLLVGNTEPEGGRGDSGYYLPGIWVAHRVSLAHRGGRDAHRVKRDEHPPLPYEHPPLHWKCVGGRGGSLPPLWASIFGAFGAFYVYFQPMSPARTAWF